MGIQHLTNIDYLEQDTNLPSLSGTIPEEIGAAGSYVELYIGTERFILDIDPQTGGYSWGAVTPYLDGEYSATLRVFDAAGNVSPVTLFTLVIDTTPPEAPQLINLFDDVGGVTGSFDSGDTTDDARPTLTGVAQKGSTVFLRDASGNNIGSAVADKITGVWVIEPLQDLPSGSNSLTLVAVETFANKIREGSVSEPFIIVVNTNTLPPDTITIHDALDDAGAHVGSLASGALTDDTTPTLRGDVSAGNSVTVYWRLVGSSSWAGSATATVSGEQWSWTPDSALPAGEYQFQAAISGGSSSLFMLDIATDADIALKTRILYAEDNVGVAQGKLVSGAITDDTTPELHGRGEANSQVTLRYTSTDGSAATVIVDVDSAGNWHWTPDAALAFGSWKFEVQAQGQTEWQAAFNLSLAQSSVSNPKLIGVFDNFDKLIGYIENGGLTNDKQPEFQGIAEANSLVYIHMKWHTGLGDSAPAPELYSVFADADGKWSWTPEVNLHNSVYYISVRNTPTTNWHDAFKLGVAHRPDIYTIEIDLENPPANFKIGQLLNHYYNYDFAINGTGTLSQSPLNSPTSFGEGSLRLLPGQNIEFNKNDNYHSYSWDRRPISNFSVQIYNDSNIKSSVKATFTNLDGKVFSGTFEVSANGLIELNENSIPGLILSEIEVINIRNLTSKTSIYVDNFKYTLMHELDEYLQDFNIDATHQIAAVEELLQQPIIGNPYQVDELKLTGKDIVLDLSKHATSVKSVEIFDITGKGSNTLKLDTAQLLAQGEKNLFIDDGKTQLMVKGNRNDIVKLSDIFSEGENDGEWLQMTLKVTVAGAEYNVYTHSILDAELLVQEGVKTELL